MATLGVEAVVAGTKTSYIVPREREIVFQRVYEAPRENVFRLFTDPKRIPEWWGTKEAPVTVVAMDVRRGGVWRFTQRDQQGNTHAFHGVYKEVDAPNKVVSTFQYEMPGMPKAAGMPVIEETYEFIDRGGKTLVKVTSAFPSGAALGGMISVGMDTPGPYIEGTRHQWRLERLAALGGW